MKIITFRIPTSIAEVKQMRKKQLSKRHRNNEQVIRDVIDDIIKIAWDGYWRADIRETMRTQVFRHAPYSRKFQEIYCDAISKLK